MGRYLTNTDLNEEDRCKYASEESGFDVVFLPHPMPKDYSDPDDDNYHPDALWGVCAGPFILTNLWARIIQNFGNFGTSIQTVISIWIKGEVIE